MGGECYTYIIPRLILALAGTVMMMMTTPIGPMATSIDYADALSKSILFFEGQRSGKIPSTQRITWRKDSGLQDGSDIGMDLVGGYYDAGDNVKFSFPMAFTVATLAWSVIEFGQLMGSEQQNALEAIRWGTDYLLKATSVPDVVVGVVGDPNADHDCWERPEDMDTPRTTYVVNKTSPGSEVSAEIAAALAASSIAFLGSDAKYSKLLLDRAKQVFDFADQFQGSYNSSIPQGACPFYCDFSGYVDELLWGAAWLHKATNDAYYWNYIQRNLKHLETRDIDGNPFEGAGIDEFGWDSKTAGINVLISQRVMKDPNNGNPFIFNADQFVCSILPDSTTVKSVSYSPGGLIFKDGGSNLQHATALSFLLIVYARYMIDAKKVVRCGDFVAQPDKLIEVAKGQTDYILGKNPLGMSYMVGYGQKFPQKIHHRGSTIPSIVAHPKFLGCHGGDLYFKSQKPDMNQLTGAVIGGPAKDDSFENSRYNVPQSEPTTYMNSPFVGVLAYFKASV